MYNVSTLKGLIKVSITNMFNELMVLKLVSAVCVPKSLHPSNDKE